LEELKGSYNS